MGFRWFVCDHGRRLGLAGWVRNTRQGTVELTIEGSASDVHALQDLVSRGPHGSTVRAVSWAEEGGADRLPFPFAIVRQ